jgi:hypothetical protein
VIQRHGSIVVEVAEQLQVPHNRYGLVMPTGSLFLTRGIVFAPAKVEPAFADKLKLRLFNTTQKPVTLKKGEKLASVVFLPTESTERQTRVIRGSDISRNPPSRLEDLGRWFGQHKTVWIGWIVTFVSSSLLTFALTYWVYYRPTLALLEQQRQAPSQLPSESTQKTK